MRGMAAFLPPPLRLIDDPYGLRFAGALGALHRGRLAGGARAAAPLWLRGRLRTTVMLMQLRTRVLDDDVEVFVGAGGAAGAVRGRQLVLLGAGFDCRAWRLPALADATVYEVDHLATQERKRAVMEGEPTGARVVFVPWHFEREPLDRLPARLGLVGHDRGAPTMTISEGVLPYLSEDAVDATFACIARYSSPGSRVSFTYFDRSLLADRSRHAAGERVAVRLLGEPYRHGFDPVALPAWFAARGMTLARDESSVALARRFFPSEPEVARTMSHPHRARRHFASATIGPR
jgi:methyltransferase (TIGR00027 family)